MATTEDYGLGQFTFPRGWFAVARIADVGNTPIPIRAFAQDYVLYRGKSGKLVLLDAYCPHMGSHLASGQIAAMARQGAQIKGDTIACPLHGWRFGPDGVCTEIAYSPLANPGGISIKSHIVREYAGLVMMWHDEEGLEPNFEPAPLPEWTDPGYINTGVTPMGVLDMHHVEIVDHHADKIHSVVIHGHEAIIHHRLTFKDHTLSMDGAYWDKVEDGSLIQNRTVTDYQGCGVMIARSLRAPRRVFYMANTPVEDGRFQAWLGLAMEIAGATATPEEEDLLAKSMAAGELNAVEDLDILLKKKPTLKPVQIVGDGPFRRVRAWYSQYYNPRSETAALQAKTNGEVCTEGDVPAPWAAVA